MRTHYDNLHVSEKASPEVIKGAYKALAQKWHPDKHPNQREKAERYFKERRIKYQSIDLTRFGMSGKEFDSVQIISVANIDIRQVFGFSVVRQ